MKCWLDTSGRLWREAWLPLNQNCGDLSLHAHATRSVTGFRPVDALQVHDGAWRLVRQAAVHEARASVARGERTVATRDCPARHETRDAGDAISRCAGA